MSRYPFRTFLLPLILFASSGVSAMQGANGRFVVGIGPIELGNVNLSSTCNATTCFYRARAKGSFMFIGADVNEKGSFKHKDGKVLPISTDYSEKVGSKQKAFSYDFITKEIEDRRKKEQTEMPENAYTFMPLLNQVLLDLLNGGPKAEYAYLSKNKSRTATISEYRTEQTENGIMHRFIGVGKDKDSKTEFFFLQKGDSIALEKISI